MMMPLHELKTDPENSRDIHFRRARRRRKR
jgi:hypothetical protein